MSLLNVKLYSHRKLVLLSFMYSFEVHNPLVFICFILELFQLYQFVYSCDLQRVLSSLKNDLKCQHIWLDVLFVAWRSTTKPGKVSSLTGFLLGSLRSMAFGNEVYSGESHRNGDFGFSYHSHV